MRILVTGGAGFIGSNLIKELINQNNFIVCLDDLSHGFERNIKEFLDNKNFIFVKGDIRDLKLINKIIKDYSIDYISHQAARCSVPKSIENPILITEINIKGTLNILWAAKESRVKKVVIASSSSIYGDLMKLPKKESMNYDPKSPYAITKIVEELYSKNFYDLYGLKTICLRYFNVYGPKQNPEGDYSAAIPKFINSALSNKSLTIFGDGTQTRDFIFVQDVVNVNISALKKEVIGNFNIGSGKRISINELAKKIIEITSSKSKIIYLPERKGDLKDSLADISLAKKYLDFNPKYNLEEGLKITTEWIKNNSKQ